MKTLTLILVSALVLPRLAVAQKETEADAARSTDHAVGRRDSIGVAPGDIALAAFLAPVRTQPIRSRPEEGHSIFHLRSCEGRGQWKCIVGGVALGFIAGALVGDALTPKEVDHQEYACSGFFGCGYYIQCDAHCDEPVTKIWVFSISGAVLGGVGGYYVAKASNR